MVARNVRQYGDVCDNARGFAQPYRVRRNFGHHRVHASRPHFEKQFVHFEAVGSCQTRPHLFPLYEMPFRARKPDFEARARKQRGNVMRGRGLSVGPHDGDEFHPLRGMSPERRRHQRVCASYVVHENVPAIRFGFAFRDGNEIGFDFRKISVSVVPHPFHTKKQVAVTDFPRIDFQRIDLEISVRAHRGNPHSFEQFA